MIDYASVAFSLGYFYYFARWLDDSSRIGVFLLTIGFGVLGFLTKVTTLPTVLVPMGYLVLKNIWTAFKAEKRPLRQYVEAKAKFLASLTAIFLVPPVLCFLWVQHCDAIKAPSEYYGVFTSANLSDWNYGTWVQKTTITNWGIIIRRIVSEVVTFPGFVFVIFAPWLYFAGRRKGGEFVIAFALGAPLTIFIFFNLYWVHDYYLMAVTPSVSIVVGFCLYLVLTKLFDHKLALKRWFYIAILTIGIMLYSAKYYVSSSLTASLEEPVLTLTLANAIRDHTTEDEYVIVADVFNWNPAYLYYAKRKGFMLWYFEGDKSNQFFKKHHFTTVVHAEPHEKLFSNWKYKKVLAVHGKYKVVRVSDTSID
jgi:hypothetical protein